MTARAFKSLAPLDTEFMINVALPKFIPETLSENLLVRHGATLCIASIIASLSAVKALLPEGLLANIRDIVPAIEKNRLYRGRGG